MGLFVLFLWTIIGASYLLYFYYNDPILISSLEMVFQLAQRCSNVLVYECLHCGHGGGTPAEEFLKTHKAFPSRVCNCNRY